MIDAFGRETGLVLGVGIGIAFGFVLERSGFGRANILAAQFYFTDMRVLKVMFTAIVTALLGITVLSGVGLMDLSLVSVPHTYLWPQLVGGLLLGIGFIVSGYCPGTGLVATASGKLDGLFAIFGVMLGSVAFGAGFPLYADFYHSGDLGVLRLPDLLGLPDAVLAIGVTLMAVGAFTGAEALERKFKDDSSAPTGSRGIRRPVFAALVAVSLFSMFTLLAPKPEPSQAQVAPERIDAVALAQTLIEAPGSVFIVDMRADVPDKERIPGAVPVTADDPNAGFIADLPGTRKLVLYGQADLDELPPAAHRFEGRVYVLEGGYEAFASGVLEAPVLVEDPTPADISDYQLRSALHSHFTGASLSNTPPPPRPKKKIQRKGKKEGGC
jgi:hypothetical protein